MENYDYISIHKDKANTNLKKLCRIRPTELNPLITYFIHSGYFDSSTTIENLASADYICESVEEFNQKVAEYKLLRVLWQYNLLV